jgi:hypothetical protein
MFGIDVVGEFVSVRLWVNTRIMCPKNSDEGSAMSLSPTPINDVPELTAQVARAAFPNGNRYMQMRDTLGPIYAVVQVAVL